MNEATIRAQVELQYALDRMSTPLHASRLSDATAAEDARCMAIIRAEIDRLRAALQHEADCVEAAKAEIDRLTRERNEARARCIEETRALVTQREDLASRAAQYMQERDEARAERDAMRAALTFYAKQEHFILSDDNAWDTVSGEPPNYWCDEAGTATVEDGSIARLVLAGELVDLEDDAQAEDAARYRLVRRGQHWSVINGIGDQLRADALDAAIDAQIEQEDNDAAM